MFPTRTRLASAGARINYPIRERVTAQVALVLGVGEATAHQYLYGAARLNRRVASVIEALIRSGDRGALAHFLAPIHAAERGILAPADSDALAEQAAVADGDEETAEIRYERTPCEATARAFVLALDTERALQLERRQAVAAKWGLT